MNNNHEYTIFEENGAFFRGQGGCAEDLARLVAVGDPFEVLMTAYGNKQKVLRQTTVQVSGVGSVLQTWLGYWDSFRIKRITYKIAPAYLNRWIDVSSCDRKPVPHGTKFLWEVNGYSIAREPTFELPKFKHWGLNRIVPGFGVTSVFIPEGTDGFYPWSFTPAWAAEPKKADQKSSFRTLSANCKAEVQSDICPACGKAEGEHSAGCPVVEFKAKY